MRAVRAYTTIFPGLSAYAEGMDRLRAYRRPEPSSCSIVSLLVSGFDAANSRSVDWESFNHSSRVPHEVFVETRVTLSP